MGEEKNKTNKQLILMYVSGVKETESKQRNKQSLGMYIIGGNKTNKQLKSAWRKQNPKQTNQKLTKYPV